VHTHAYSTPMQTNDAHPCIQHTHAYSTPMQTHVDSALHDARDMASAVIKIK